MQPMAQTFDVCIRGAGIVGRTLALLLARERLRVALVAAPRAEPSQADVRAYALNTNSKQLLESLRTWPDAPFATAVKHMEVHGDVDGSVHFDAGAQGVEALAWIVDVPALEQRLAEAVRYQPQVEVVDSPVQAPLTAICEGRASATRAEFGVDFDVTPYGQHAIATRLRCELPHGQVARQWFSPQGILALLPLEGADGHSVAVVWSVAQADAAHWQSTDEATFTQALSEISQRQPRPVAIARPAYGLAFAASRSQALVWPIPRNNGGSHPHQLGAGRRRSAQCAPAGRSRFEHRAG